MRVVIFQTFCVDQSV